jgi:hypothetical protein
MSADPQTALLRRINDTRAAISDHLSRLEPFGTSLTYTNILCGTIATALTGGLAAFASHIPGRGTLIVAASASACSLVATIAASVHKTRVGARLAKTQACAAKLDGLAVLIETSCLPIKEAANRYNEYLAACPPIPSRHASGSEANGTITMPAANQAVGRTIAAAGHVSGLDESTYLWIAIEVDDRIWPKEGRLSINNQHQWNQEVYEDGKADEFSLSLWAVNLDADRKLRAWLESGNQSGTFPELRRLAGMRRLARVDRLRHQV